MINRGNYKDVQDFLDLKLKQKCIKKTIEVYDVWLRHALEWCDDVPFYECQKKKESLPDYVESLVKQGKISDETARRICTIFSEFLEYEALENKDRYKNIKSSFIKSIKFKTYSDSAKIPDYYTLEEMRKIANVQTDDLTMKRTQAGACLMYLSGMRIRAFLTLPIECLNLEKMQVYQFPEKGVYTKFNKRAITSLYNIPELLKVVKEWDEYIRSVTVSSSTWYPRYDTTGKAFRNYQPETKDRNKAYQEAENAKKSFYKDLQKLCTLADVEYKNPHAFRHGHAHYGMKNARTPEEQKAVSLNLMHNSMATTDKVYSQMNAGDTNTVITNLGITDSRPQMNINTMGLTAADILASMTFEEKMKLLGMAG